VVELAEIFRRHGPAYRARFGERMLPGHLKAMRAIEQCRTAALGGQVYDCPHCGESRYVYHSCRDRHCPKCQNANAQEWLVAQHDLLLPTPYFMLTFTLPAALRDLARSNQRLFYDLLFRASAQAVQTLARDPRFLGGQLGLVGVLHTWGRNLAFHPHVHYLAPAGVVAVDGHTWLSAQHANFLLPVKALSPIFRAKFRDALRASDCFAQIPASVWQQPWVVHCQPVGDGWHALKYLAPYIFRVAISNARILKLENGRVTFRYRSSDTQRTTLCTLPAEEFIHRFLQHVLPKGFVKVRYYGFFAPALRPRLAAVRQQLRGSPACLPVPAPPQTAPLCPICGRPMLRCSDAPPVDMTGNVPGASLAPAQEARPP
jgi:hypothetical protein